jgi:uncharacterized membrane protein
MVYNDVIEKIGMTIDAAGVAVIVAGAAFSFVACAVRLSRRERDVYRRLRQHLGQTILLGLELLVAGDIVRTVAASPDLMGVAILASIVGIRTLLSFSLEVELTGRLPWQKGDAAAT